MIIGRFSHDWAKKAGLPFWYADETTSTNAVAKEAALMEKEGIRLYFTDLQTQGKGRGTHTWLSTSPGAALLSSWSFQTRSNPQPVLSPMLGLALYRAFQATYPQLPFSLKAPNDLYLDDKKVAGLLIENITVGEKNRLIIGLGVNVMETPELETAVSLIEYLAEVNPQDWAQCLDRILLEFTMAIAGTGATLSVNSQEALLNVLNLNPNLTEPYTAVTAYGDLEVGKKTIKWSEL